MRFLSKWLLRISAILLVFLALTISGLRLALPHIDSYRPQLLSLLSKISGTELYADHIQARWLTQGPVLRINNLNLRLADHSTLSIGEVSLSLNIWRSLIATHWQFTDLTFRQLQFKTTQGLGAHAHTSHTGLDSERLQQLFLHRFNHFILRESWLEFPSPSGQQVRLYIPALTWFNQQQQHRADGLVSLSSDQGEHGTGQLRINLRDKGGVIDNGQIWLQAKNLDARPWLGKWMNQQSALEQAHLSLTLWLNVKDGGLAGGDILIPTGEARWRPLAGQTRKSDHKLAIKDFHAKLSQAGSGWQLPIPHQGIQLDHQPWSKGSITLYWQPDSQRQFLPAEGAEFRVRASQINLQRLTPIITLFTPISAKCDQFWHSARPQGIVDQLSVDVPLNAPERSRLAINWQNISWQAWNALPAISGLAGHISGELNHGAVALELGEQQIDIKGELQAPLHLNQLSGQLGWDMRNGDFTLSGKELKVQAQSISAAGNFNYQQIKGQAPWLEILAGIDVSQADDAWRYFPIKIMPPGLVRYLSTAIQGGNTKNATLLFSGNPQQFPFMNQQGKFQVSVPLQHAKFAFQPGWPVLNDQAIDLNFVNNGLSMQAPLVKLGQVSATQVTVNIPDYQHGKLYINAGLVGEGEEIRRYFHKTPLAKSIGNALNQVQVRGGVTGDLQLTIPLNGEQVTAEGNVVLNNNQLIIKSLSSQLDQVSGRFHYKNGQLQSQTLSARWYGEPLKINFSTAELANAFAVDLDLQASWHPSRVSLLPKVLRQQLSGVLPWQSKVAIRLPHQGGANYQVDLTGEANQVTGYLPNAVGIRRNASLPIKIHAKGGLRQFQLSGAINQHQRFNSLWLLEPKLRLERGQWQTQARSTPDLPFAAKFFIDLPAIEGDRLVKAWQNGASKSHTARQYRSKTKSTQSKFASLQLPEFEVTTPALNLGGQIWKKLNLTISNPLQTSINLRVKSEQLTGSLTIDHATPWLLNLDYLYYNPQFQKASNPASQTYSRLSDLDFRQWPDINARCKECWFVGQKIGQISANVKIDRGKLLLTNGLIDNGHSQLALSGYWQNQTGSQLSAIRGKFQTDNLNDAAAWFNQSSPLSNTSGKLDFDLYWHNLPWKPELSSLSGLLKLSTGSGTIESIQTGRTGQLLRLFNIDALLRKLRLDFNDALDLGFHFDSIKATAWIEQGVLRTDNLHIDGLEADIDLKGKVDLLQRRINMFASVVPEISVPVGVATAFAINPIVGAMVFATSKMLSPIWSKISLLNYQITGPIDKSQVHKVMSTHH